MKLSIISKFILSIKLRAPIKELRAAMRQQAGGRSGGLGVRLGARPRKQKVVLAM